MSIINQCQKCNKQNCSCKVYTNCIEFTPEDFTRTDIDRNVPVAISPKQPTILELIADISDLVERTPNDSELGAKVRKLFI